MSCRILTVGHIKCLEYLASKDKVIVGLLTGKALEGYKQELVPYRDRKYILDTVSFGIDGLIRVVPQYSLNPTRNIRRFKCTAIASGDGWEAVEEAAILKYRLKKINLKLDREKNKKWSSSAIIKRAKVVV